MEGSEEVMDKIIKRCDDALQTIKSLEAEIIAIRNIADLQVNLHKRDKS
jgi:hypothetical protein